MKKIAIAAVMLLGLSAGAYAQDAMGSANIEKIKQDLLKKVDEQIQALQASKACYAAAADMAGIKTCRQKQRDGIRNAGNEARQERLAEQQKRVEAKQKRLEEKQKRLKEAQQKAE